jgi:hypothetical protein
VRPAWSRNRRWKASAAPDGGNPSPRCQGCRPTSSTCCPISCSSWTSTRAQGSAPRTLAVEGPYVLRGDRWNIGARKVTGLE